MKLSTSFLNTLSAIHDAKSVDELKKTLPLVRRFRAQNPTMRDEIKILLDAAAIKRDQIEWALPFSASYL